ncbi:MAG: TonB-dependent receptor [Planctomycetes bacterium]|nr:TonB-dependent receptor [Planctomycetota bacterium]
MTWTAPAYSLGIGQPVLEYGKEVEMMNGRIHLAVLMLLSLPATSHAQETTGNLEGTVLTADRQPVAYVDIVVSGPNLLGTRGTAITSEGFFRIPALPPGTYNVTLSHVSYQTVSIDGVRIHLGRTTNLGVILMTVKVHEMPPMVVTADRLPLIDPDFFGVGANLKASDFRALPIQRDYRSMGALLPHVNESFLGDELNIAGATGLDNKYYIDGVDTTDPVRGITGTSLPYNFVREVQVRSGSYAAEYSGALGGVMNVITHSGRNEFKGNAFGFFLNNRFTAEPRLATYEPGEGDFAEYDVGIGLGGPIVRDRLWFYAAYNPSYWIEDVEIPGQGTYQDRFTAHRLAGKLDWRIDARNSLNFTATGNPTLRDGVGDLYTRFGIPTSFANPDPYLYDIESGGLTLSLQGKHLLGERLLLKTGVSRFTWRKVYRPDTQRGRSEMLYIDAETGIWSGGAADDIDDRSTVSTFYLDGICMLDRHALKAGLAFKINRYEFSRHTQELTRDIGDVFRLYEVDNVGSTSNRIPSIYLQDTWHLSERFRLNAGLRWEGQFMIDTNDEVAQRVTDQWQPRIGFTYQPGEIGTQKIFGSFGRYYHVFASHLSTWYHSDTSRLLWEYYSCDPRICALPPDSTRNSVGNHIQDEVDGLAGQHFDEFSLGYERQLSAGSRLAIRGIHRVLREAVEDGYSTEVGDWVYGNPGSGQLNEYPKAKHEYSALELSYEYFRSERFDVRAAYILSRNYGNYMGLYNSDFFWAAPNANGSFDVPEIMVDGTGLLPNDRTHVIKLSGSYRVGAGLTLGGSATWQSGTPKNEWGGTPWEPPYYSFLQTRGEAGRTPSIWDLNLRASYLLPPIGPSIHARLLVDIFHLGSQREAVLYDMIHYRNIDPGDGSQIDPNPNYGQPIRFQPPMAVRVGVDLDF